MENEQLFNDYKETQITIIEWSIEDAMDDDNIEAVNELKKTLVKVQDTKTMEELVNVLQQQ